MENNLTASEQLALLQPTATGSSGPTPEEKLMANIRSFTPPSVSGARAELNQIQNLIRDQESRRVNEAIAARPDVSPFQPGLSASQQFTRQRAAQDKMISDAYAKAGVPLSAADLSSMQSQVRQDPGLTEVDPTFLYEKRVADAYKSIGRTGPIVPFDELNKPGATADSFRAVDREGFDYWLNKLKSGEISGDQFQEFFLKEAAGYAGPGANLLADPISKAKTELDKLTAGQASGTGTTTTTTPGTGTSTTTTPGTATQAEKDDLSKSVFGGTYITTPGTTTPGTGTSTTTTPVTTTPVTTTPGTGISTTTSGPTREQVLAAYAANPKAVLNPDEAAINFFMQPGKLANFNTIVDEVRAADPALASKIDAERRIAASNPYQQYINPSVPTNPYQQYINPSVPTNPYQRYTTTPNQDQGLMRFLRNGGSVKK
jgi:hypothetical protein